MVKKKRTTDIKTYPFRKSHASSQTLTEENVKLEALSKFQALTLTSMTYILPLFGAGFIYCHSIDSQWIIPCFFAGYMYLASINSMKYLRRSWKGLCGKPVIISLKSFLIKINIRVADMEAEMIIICNLHNLPMVFYIFKKKVKRIKIKNILNPEMRTYKKKIEFSWILF